MLHWRNTLIGAITLIAGMQFAAADELHLSHVNAPNDLIHLAAEKFAAAVAERTNGALTIVVHPASSLAGLRDGVEGVRLGTIDIAIADSGTLGNWIPEMGFFSLPFMFDDFAHERRVLAGPVGDWRRQKVREVLAAELIASAPIGQRIMVSRTPIATPADIKGLTFRVPEIPVYVRMVTELGGNPTPVPFADVYMALQTGVIEAAEGTATSAMTAKFDEVSTHASRVHHIMLDNAVVMNATRFDTLPADQQQVIKEAAAEFFDGWLSTQRETAEDEAWAYMAGKVEGNASPDREAFRRALAPMVKDFVAETTTEDLLAQVEAAR